MSWELNALLGEKEFLGHKFSEKVSFIIADAYSFFSLHDVKKNSSWISLVYTYTFVWKFCWIIKLWVEKLIYIFFSFSLISLKKKNNWKWTFLIKNFRAENNYLSISSNDFLLTFIVVVNWHVFDWLKSNCIYVNYILTPISKLEIQKGFQEIPPLLCTLYPSKSPIK